MFRRALNCAAVPALAALAVLNAALPAQAEEIPKAPGHRLAGFRHHLALRASPRWPQPRDRRHGSGRRQPEHCPSSHARWMPCHPVHLDPPFGENWIPRSLARLPTTSASNP